MKKTYQTPKINENQVHGKSDMLVKAVGGSVGAPPPAQNAKEFGGAEVDDNDFWSTN